MLNPTTAASAFLLPIPGLVPDIQKEIAKMPHVLSKASNSKAWILGEINHKLGKLPFAVLQNQATREYLLKKKHKCWLRM